MGAIAELRAARAGTARRRHHWQAYLWIAPTAIVLVALTVYPTIYMVYISFFRWSVIPTLPRDFVGFGQYQTILRDSTFWSSVRVTLIFFVVAVSLELLLGYILATSLRTNRRSIRAVRALFLLPTIIAPVVAGLAWKFMLLLDLGIVNYLIGLVGIPKVAWLGDTTAAVIAILLIDVWQWTPFVMLILLAGMESLPTEPFEAARVDGASAWQMLRYVTLPLLLPLITVALMFRTFDAIKTFDVVYMVTQGGPGNATSLLSYDIWKKGFFENQLGYAAALSVLMLILVTILARLYFRVVGQQLRTVEH